MRPRTRFIEVERFMARGGAMQARCQHRFPEISKTCRSDADAWRHHVEALGQQKSPLPERANDQFTFFRAAAKRSGGTNSLKRAASLPELSRMTTVGRPSTRYFFCSAWMFGSSSSVASTRIPTKRDASVRTSAEGNVFSS